MADRFYMNHAPMKQKGFTLIELLVVISIIGLLASVVLVAVNSARVKARDAKRVADVSQMQKGLELYYNENGQYPLSGGASSPNVGWSNSNDSSWAALQALLQPYINRLPHDPKENSSGWPADGTNFSFAYYSQSYGCHQQWYMLVYKLETAKDPDPGMKACDGTYFQYGGAGVTTQVKTVGNRGQ